jgi:hypothetical protein
MIAIARENEALSSRNFLFIQIRTKASAFFRLDIQTGKPNVYFVVPECKVFRSRRPTHGFHGK